MRTIRTIGVCLAFAVALTVGFAAPASADNPTCPTNYTSTVAIHIIDGHYRAKACYRGVYNDFAYQDTYADGWSADFSWPNNTLTDYLHASDRDGAMNGWNVHYASYPHGFTDYMTLCSYDYSQGVSHGCTTASILT